MAVAAVFTQHFLCHSTTGVNVKALTFKDSNVKCAAEQETELPLIY